MGQFKVGFSRLDITPPLGIHIAGYYNERIADGILDNLEANCIAVSDGEKTAVIYSIDIISVCQEQMDIFRKHIAKVNNIPYEAVYIACTHTHTGPAVGRGESQDDPEYNDILCKKLSDAAKLAIEDLKPATVGIGRGKAEKVSFVRRYRMKNGKIQTNPGVGNPEIEGPIGSSDDTVQVVRLMREGAAEIVIVNFQVHPDTIGGCKISADYPRFVRETVEGALPGVKCVYFNGAQGDTNHVNVNAKGGDLNGLEVESFDDVARGYEHSKHMGRAIAGGALQVYGKTDAVQVDRVNYGQSYTRIPSNRVDASLIPGAEKILELHNSGRDDEIPFRGMELTTVVAEAQRMKDLENGPDDFVLYTCAVSFGGVAFSGIPGEPFTDIGRAIKEQSPFTMTIPCCLVNGSEGYYPMQSAYDEGGYEARSSKFKAGVAEKLIDSSVALLKEIHG